MEERIKSIERRLDKLEETLGIVINNQDLQREVIEFLEEATMEELIEEMRKETLYEDGIVEEDGEIREIKDEKTKVRRKEFDQ